MPQQAWIQNATVRDNVLFGKAYQAERYKTVIRACQLERDLSILPAGDLTEIGEKVYSVSSHRDDLEIAIYLGRDAASFKFPSSSSSSSSAAAAAAPPPPEKLMLLLLLQGHQSKRWPKAAREPGTCRLQRQGRLPAGRSPLRRRQSRGQSPFP